MTASDFARSLAVLSAVLALAVSGAFAVEPATRPADDLPRTSDNVGHDRHLHAHNAPHPTAATQPGRPRFHTSRPDAIQLPLPTEEDAFAFVIFGDRTGGPADGVAVLADAVRDANLLEPDLVMTVGDLINGYNETPQWLEQMREFKGVMNELLCPWFPVAGNHDVYWRDRGGDEQRPVGEHESNYELRFGPLWYAFEHKNSWFVVLYSDEGNPDTGEKRFNRPDAQRMSPEQMAWLAEMLAAAKDADHVFVFLHHPRWLRGQYGDDWEKVHAMLVDAGNVTAVFAGHIHRMRYDGPTDGIEYVTLATVGGGNDQTVPEAGMLHQIHLVTVRKEQVAMAALPVGATMDVREITGDLATDAESLATLAIDQSDALLVSDADAGFQLVTVTLTNPARLPIEVELVPDSRDSRWRMTPDHAHLSLAPGESAQATFAFARPAGSLDEAYRVPEFVLNMDMLARATRYGIPSRRVPVEVRVPRDWPLDATDRAAEFAGAGAVAIASDDLELPDGPMTLEAWVIGDDYAGRTGLVCKTQGSEYGLFGSDGVPSFSIFLGDRYATVSADEAWLEPGRWHHVAGVYDGNAMRLYVDGRLVASQTATGPRRANRLPLLVGADVDARGNLTSGFDGRVDDVRLSSTARYSGDQFQPKRPSEADAQTVLLLDMNRALGETLPDLASGRLIGRLVGDAVLAEE